MNEFEKTNRGVSDTVSPLRYPGGKSRVAVRLAKLFPNFREFREPFVGGGSVFLEVAKLRPDAKYWINDLYPEVANFWKVAVEDLASLVDEVLHLRKSESDGRKLYALLRQLEPEGDAQRAARFFILNRITFSGTLDSGGYSQMAFDGRFTGSSIARLEKLSFLEDVDVKVTNLDYSHLLNAPGFQVALYLDPPYITKGKKLYGKGGDLHRIFNHESFAQQVLASKHSWLVTYNDGEFVNRIFPPSDAVMQLRWEQHYPMKNALGPRLPKGQELIIANFELSGGSW
jgi:DNA adenine methylase